MGGTNKKDEDPKALVCSNMISNCHQPINPSRVQAAVQESHWYDHPEE